METNLNYAPHPGQKRLHASDARFRVACCGRRWGKTLGFTADILDKAGTIPGDYGWIAPTYQTTERGIDAIRQIADPPIVEIRGSGPRYADVLGRSRIFYLSADNPDSIRGYGFRGVILDEAPYIGHDAWNYVIAPTISQTQGWAAFVGTPWGRNWFFDEHTKGNDPAFPDHDSFVFPSNENPYFPPSEFENLRRTVPDMIFRQEYLAEFLEDSAGVFRGIENCLTDRSCDHSGPFVMGVDLAKHQDFTVCLGLCAQCGCGRWFDRFNKLDWPVQVERISRLAMEHDALTLIDSTGLGDPIYDDLQLTGIIVDGYRLTGQSKTALIQGLMVAIEQRRISWPRSWEILTAELQRYEYEYGASGTLRYNAPEGFHDDCVIALALAVQAMSRSRHGRPGLIMSRTSRDKFRDIQHEIRELIAAAETSEERAELEAMLNDGERAT